MPRLVRLLRWCRSPVTWLGTMAISSMPRTPLRPSMMPSRVSKRRTVRKCHIVLRRVHNPILSPLGHGERLIRKFTFNLEIRAISSWNNVGMYSNMYQIFRRGIHIYSSVFLNIHRILDEEQMDRKFATSSCVPSFLVDIHLTKY